VTLERRTVTDLAGVALGPVLVDTEVAVAILQQPDLSVAYANPAHTGLFGWRTGTSPRGVVATGPPRARPDPTGAILDAAERVLHTGEPVRFGELRFGDRFLHVVCSPVRTASVVSGVTVVTVDITDQVRARRRAEERHRRLSVLDDATSAVNAEMEPRRELIALADSVVPGLADACAVYLIDAPGSARALTETWQGTRLVCVIDPALGLSAPAPEVRLRLAPTRPVTRAVREGRAILASGHQADPSGWGEYWLTVLDPHSLVAVPIGSPDEVLAVVSFAAAGRRPRYGDSDIALMHEITSRVAVAVGHALRLQRTSEVALALQRGLLSEPPEVKGLDIRVRYRPAGPGLEVGGDWYDAFALPAGDLALAVGDVVGHDLHATSTMGQLRSMAQALACQPDAEPAGVLASLNRLSSHLGIGELATMVYGQLTPPVGDGPATLTWANAGHPPPLLVNPDGSVAILDQAASPLLGLPVADYRQASVALPPGSVLLLYTDGLMEDPDRPSVDAVAELAEAVRRLAPTGLDGLCDRLLAAAPTRDDIALLAVRVLG
jgi:serine phosphatase RsbU (regulator of sigma subunit)